MHIKRAMATAVVCGVSGLWLALTMPVDALATCVVNAPGTWACSRIPPHTYCAIFTCEDAQCGAVTAAPQGVVGATHTDSYSATCRYRAGVQEHYGAPCIDPGTACGLSSTVSDCTRTGTSAPACTGVKEEAPPDGQ